MIAYHYTRGERLKPIRSDGFIRPSTAGCEPGETPIVWLTMQDTFPPTAAAGDMPAKVLKALGGACRIAVDEEHLQTWVDFRDESGIQYGAQIEMEDTAMRANESPGDWRVHVGPIPQALWLTIEVLRDGKWRGIWWAS